MDPEEEEDSLVSWNEATDDWDVRVLVEQLHANINAQDVSRYINNQKRIE